VLGLLNRHLGVRVRTSGCLVEWVLPPSSCCATSITLHYTHRAHPTSIYTELALSDSSPHSRPRLCFRLKSVSPTASMSASPIHMSNRFALPNGIASAVMERHPTGNSDAIATPPPRANGHASGSGTYGPSSTPQIDHNATPGPSTAPLPTPATATPNGNAPTDKPEKKRKKKGWKGWAMVIEDAQGNVLEINDGPPPAPLPSRRDKIKQEEESVLQDTPEPVVNSEFSNRTFIFTRSFDDIFMLVDVKSPTPYIARYETNGASPEPLFQSNSKKARAARGESSLFNPLVISASSPSFITFLQSHFKR
jgi:hypothetical protein